MGAGSSALIWYGLCFGFVAFVVIVTAALILYGQLVEARRRSTLAEAPESAADGTGDEPKAPGTTLDHTAGDR